MKPIAVQSTLTVFAEDLSATIGEKINQFGTFTTVTDNPPAEISRGSVCLLCLGYPFAGHTTQITHICFLEKGQRVATGQVRVKGRDIIQLSSPIHAEDLVSRLSKKLQYPINRIFTIGYKDISPALGQNLWSTILEMCPDQKDELLAFASRRESKAIVHSPRAEDAAVEKDAVGLCLDIFGIDRQAILKRWQATDGSVGESFLNGLDSYVAYEDDIISHDLHTLPGWKAVSKSITGVVDFENSDGDKLTIINANRKPLEKALGVDLIYFHRTYDAFTLIQYKMMDQKTSKDQIYYNPNQKSHEEELERMDYLYEQLRKERACSNLKEFRINTCPIFFKLCKKIALKQNEGTISPGAYIPLDQWKLLLKDTSTQGVKGGVQLGFHTLNKRYLGTQNFVDLVKLGFVGSYGNGTAKLALFIEEAIESGHSVIYAVEDVKKAQFTKLESEKIDSKSLIDLFD